MSEDA